MKVVGLRAGALLGAGVLGLLSGEALASRVASRATQQAQETQLAETEVHDTPGATVEAADAEAAIDARAARGAHEQGLVGATARLALEIYLETPTKLGVRARNSLGAEVKVVLASELFDDRGESIVPAELGAALQAIAPSGTLEATGLALLQGLPAGYYRWQVTAVSSTNGIAMHTVTANLHLKVENGRFVVMAPEQWVRQSNVLIGRRLTEPFVPAPGPVTREGDRP